jgi:hypothetical protein
MSVFGIQRGDADSAGPNERLAAIIMRMSCIDRVDAAWESLIIWGVLGASGVWRDVGGRPVAASRSPGGCPRLHHPFSLGNCLYISRASHLFPFFPSASFTTYFPLTFQRGHHENQELYFPIPQFPSTIPAWGGKRCFPLQARCVGREGASFGASLSLPAAHLPTDPTGSGRRRVNWYGQRCLGKAGPSSVKKLVLCPATNGLCFVSTGTCRHLFLPHNPAVGRYC